MDMIKQNHGTRQFFIRVQAGSTAASILGNASHALLAQSSTVPAVAVALAVCLPIGQLVATHGVHKLVEARIVGWEYRVALAVAVAVAASAFVLSFISLRDLAIGWGGVPVLFAWLVPVMIDLSITGSTVSLLGLSNKERAQLAAEAALAEHAEHVHAVIPNGAPIMPGVDVHLAVHNEVHTGAPYVDQVSDVRVVEEPRRTGITVAEVIAREAALDEAVAAQIGAAERILDAGVVRIDRVKVAHVLAEHVEGTAPGTIARKVGVGYSTVVRILEHHTAPQPAEVLA